MPNGQQTTLRGWKEIAAHAGRDVRTVQRWERQRGFPVKRLPGAERGNVYALASELDEWLHPSQQSSRKDHAEVELVPDSGVLDRVEALPVAESNADDPAAAKEAQPSERHSWRLRFAFGALAATLALVAILLLRSHPDKAEAKDLRPAPGAPGHYTSPVPGVDALYLEGMYLFAKRTPESLSEAKRALLDVTQRDPKDALAWSGLAQTLTLRIEYGLETGTKATESAQSAAARALSLDTGLAEPHAVLGFADFFWDGKIKAAEPEFLTALRVNPASALARSWYGTMLTYEARYPEALDQLNEAQHLEPSSTAILASRALAMGLSGHRDEAIELLRKTVEENPIAGVRYDLSVLALVPPRLPALYLQQQLELAELTHSESQVRLYKAAQEAYRRGGEPAMWRLLANGDKKASTAQLIAGAYAVLGENDDALRVLTDAQRVSRLGGILMDPRLLPLHHDPRFKQIVSAQGLPAGS